MVLFCAHDAGPAKYLAEIIKRIGDPCCVVGSGVACEVFKGYGIESTELNKPFNAAAVSSLLRGAKPGLIVTGTSWGDAIEKYFLLCAAEMEIPALSIIDNWAWYKEGFVLGTDCILPNYIIVNDEIAQAGAIASGLPSDLLYPLGNIVLEQDGEKKMAPCSRDRWLKTLGLPDKDIITFVSEKYREDFPPGSAYYCGFDEYEVLRDILQVLNADHHLLIKLHPAEKKDKYETIAADTVTVVRETDRDSLLCHSKFIVGMGSMLLLEAALHRPDVLSYRPNDLSGFIGNRLGATYRVLDRQELKEILWGEKEVVNSGFNDKFKGSAQRILQFIEEKLP